MVLLLEEKTSNLQVHLHLEVRAVYPRGGDSGGDGSVALFELLVWPHEVEPWFHSWYRGRVETLDAKYNLMFR